MPISICPICGDVSLDRRPCYRCLSLLWDKNDETVSVEIRRAAVRKLEELKRKKEIKQ